jgi:predicted nucleic acid-binding protein
MLSASAASVVIPWPVFTEVDLLLRARGHAKAATAFGAALTGGVHRLEAPNDAELEQALAFLQRYQDLGLDLPDAVTISMAAARRAWAWTWDYRHFRPVAVDRGGGGVHLLVTEAEVPDP